MNPPNRLNNIEVGDIFRQYGAAYRKRHKLPLQSLKAMSAIESCRTAALGGHVDECDSCGHVKISYNSCRNRHCPKCQSLAKERWLEERKKELLPVSYLHGVLTIPYELNLIALINQKEIYDILFKSGTETLRELGFDPKHLGAEIGIIAILHTWGQNLMDHPHLHCIVPCGGLSVDSKEWLLPKKSTKKKKFFVHVNVISDLFKKKFLYCFKGLYLSGKLKFVGKVTHLGKRHEFEKLYEKLFKKKWITYIKRPFGGPEQVVDYLGRYTHRVAISNERIIQLENDRVTFRYRDSRDGNKNKLMTLDVFEFIRRFLLHILPFKYFKIRYYGLFSNRNRKKKIKICREILGLIDNDREEQSHKESWEELLFRLTGKDPRICPCCGKGRMVRKGELTSVKKLTIIKKKYMLL
ncbi:MAG: IS91 family transposase [Candidatus Brocadiaceae bacterium]|nr:IS91 family transposase [Candidatus Brocadiaceae bacterium]